MLNDKATLNKKQNALKITHSIIAITRKYVIIQNTINMIISIAFNFNNHRFASLCDKKIHENPCIFVNVFDL